MSRSSRRGPWLPEEDGTLLHLVRTQGPNNWVRISQHMQHRTPKQCRERYHQNLKPTLNHEPITADEGEQIERLVQVMGKRWAEIARRLGNRSDNAVKNWWNGSMNRRKRTPAPPNGVSKAVGYRTQPMSASVPHRPLYHHEAPPSPRDAPLPTYSLPPPFQRHQSTGSFHGYSASKLDHSYDAAPPMHRPTHRVDRPDLSLISPSPGFGEHGDLRRRPLSPLYPEGHPRTASLPPIRGIDVDRYRLPPIQQLEQPAPSPAATDDSQTSSHQAAPSLISDNQSSCSISPKTVPSPRPVLSGSKETATGAWKELPRPCELRGHLPDFPPASMSDDRGRPHSHNDQTGRMSRAKDHRMTVSSLVD